jgi:hypothetical protein
MSITNAQSQTVKLETLAFFSGTATASVTIIQPGRKKLIALGLSGMQQPKRLSRDLHLILMIIQ